jgi:hypothetical protein
MIVWFAAGQHVDPASYWEAAPTASGPMGGDTPRPPSPQLTISICQLIQNCQLTTWPINKMPSSENNNFYDLFSSVWRILVLIILAKRLKQSINALYI